MVVLARPILVAGGESSPAGGEKLQGGDSPAGGSPAVGDCRWFPSGQTSEFPNKRELAFAFA
jgi:hypothetical protein